MRVKTLVVLAAVLCIPAHETLAQPRTAGIATPGVGSENLATPEARLATWLKAFDDYVAQHPNLSPEQRAAISEAVGFADPGLFTDRPSPEAKAVIFRTLETLQAALPCGSYADLLSELDGLRGWLEEHRLVAAGTCTCNSDAQCASGWSCQSTSCTSEQGSTNWGTCGKGEVEIE